jgi:hypothetical protein
MIPPERSLTVDIVVGVFLSTDRRHGKGLGLPLVFEG